MILDQENSLVLIIDIQEKLLNCIYNKEIVDKKSQIISKMSNILNLPVIVTEQYPKGLGSTVTQIKDCLGENVTYFEKTDFNALADSKLVEKLSELNRKQIIILGIETHICVHQTVAELLRNGYNVTVVSDACGSRCEKEYQNGLENMKANGAKIKTSEMILFELLKTAKHPKFKEVQALIK